MANREVRSATSTVTSMILAVEGMAERSRVLADTMAMTRMGGRSNSSHDHLIWREAL